MVNTNIIIAIICLVFLIGFLLYKKFSLPKNSTPPPYSSGSTALSANSVSKNDDKKLSLKEKIELSWKFLYEITEIIINKFSKEDVALVTRCGRSLLNNGGKYEHIVDLALQTRSRTVTQGIEQGSTKEQTRGV